MTKMKLKTFSIMLSLCIICASAVGCKKVDDMKNFVDSTEVTSTAASTLATQQTDTNSAVENKQTVELKTTTTELKSETIISTTTESVEIMTEASNTSQVETSTEALPEETSSIIENSEIEYLDVNPYLGYWYIEGTSYEQELLIHESDIGTVCFSLSYYRIADIAYMTAMLNGDTAHFTSDEVEGYLLFNEDCIVVSITKSEVPYLEPETCTYDIQYMEQHLAEGLV